MGCQFTAHIQLAVVLSFAGDIKDKKSRLNRHVDKAGD